MITCFCIFSEMLIKLGHYLTLWNFSFPCNKFSLSFPTIKERRIVEYVYCWKVSQIATRTAPFLWFRHQLILERMKRYSNSSPFDTGAEDPNFMDPVLNQALIYLDKFDRSNGFLSHLNWSIGTRSKRFGLLNLGLLNMEWAD